MRDPLPAHKRAEILVRVAGAREARGRSGAADRGRGRQAAEGSPRRGRASDVDLHDGRRPGAHARRRDGPHGRVAGRRGQAGLHDTRPGGRRRSDQPFNFPLNLVAHKIAPALAAGCAVVLNLHRHRSRPLPRGARARRGPAARLAQRPRRAVLGDRRRARRGRPGRAHHVHRLERDRLGHPRARAAQAGQPRARQRDTGDRRSRRRRRRRGRAAPRTRSRSPGRAASPFSGSTCTRRSTTPSATPSCPGRGADSAIPQTRTPTSGRSSANRSATAFWPGSRRRAPPARRSSPRPRQGARQADRGRAACRFASRLRRGVRARLHAQPYTSGRGDPAANATRYGLQAGIFTSDVKKALAATRALEFGGITVNEAPTFRPTRCPTAA